MGYLRTVFPAAIVGFIVAMLVDVAVSKLFGIPWDSDGMSMVGLVSGFVCVSASLYVLTVL